MGIHFINQPKNKKYKDISLVWNNSFSKEKTEMFDKAQKFVDSECIRLMTPYTPMLNGALYKSVTLGTKIGSGELIYASPYARYQYYGKLMVSSITGSPYAKFGEKKVLTDIDLKYNTHQHPQAGAFWFERMKKDKISEVARGVEQITGGRVKLK